VAVGNYEGACELLWVALIVVNLKRAGELGWIPKGGWGGGEVEKDITEGKKEKRD